MYKSRDVLSKTLLGFYWAFVVSVISYGLLISGTMAAQILQTGKQLICAKKEH